MPLSIIDRDWAPYDEKGAEAVDVIQHYVPSDHVSVHHQRYFAPMRHEAPAGSIKYEISATGFAVEPGGHVVVIGAAISTHRYLMRPVGPKSARRWGKQ
jgi:hypothetical protein